jgi:hypothetical protein
LLLRDMRAARVDAVDLDPAMIDRARRRLAPLAYRVRLATGSATDLRAALGAEDHAYDAVFDFEQCGDQYCCRSHRAVRLRLSSATVGGCPSGRRRAARRAQSVPRVSRLAVMGACLRAA